MSMNGPYLKKMEPRSFQSYPVTGPEAKGTGSYTADAL